MNSKYNKYLAVLAAVVVVVAGTTPAFILFGKTLQPIVVQLSDDATVTKTAEYIGSQIEGSRIISAFNIATLCAVVENAYNTIFYVGHGFEDGVELGSTTLEWEYMQDYASNSPSKQHMVLACNSGERSIGNGKDWFGFPGLIDAQIGADLLLCVFHKDKGNYPDFATHRDRAMAGIAANMILGTQTPSYLSYDFIFGSIYWSAYSINPSYEIWYDHPSYSYYYSALGVGPAVSFSLAPGHGVIADHHSRLVVDIWKAGGVASIIEMLFALGVGIAVTTFQFEVTAVIYIIAGFIAACGFAIGIIANAFFQDETGSGWTFFEAIGGILYFKIGCMWWLTCTGPYAGLPLFWIDGHYMIR
ncbi:MAG: hypothetical protein E4H14_13775 [Candidatus Thorarchaeota archaeon]|nr:MAG: hypothetical protein E4H14_13775 [Candidatus Thorarchaeota archaeon]